MIGKTPRERFIIEQAVYVGLACIIGTAAILFGMTIPAADKSRHAVFILGAFVLFRGALQAVRAIGALKPSDDPPATQSYGACPMCGASTVIPGNCAECGETIVNPHAPSSEPTAPLPKRAFKMNPRNASLCLHCGERPSRPPKTTFLGFRRLRCGQCSKESLYPLSRGYFAVYWAAVILAVIFSAVMLFQGWIPVPGLLFFAAIYGLWRDRQLCQSISSNPPEGHVPDKLANWLASEQETPSQ